MLIQVFRIGCQSGLDREGWRSVCTGDMHLLPSIGKELVYSVTRMAGRTRPEGLPLEVTPTSHQRGLVDGPLRRPAHVQRSRRHHTLNAVGNVEHLPDIHARVLHFRLHNRFLEKASPPGFLIGYHALEGFLPEQAVPCPMEPSANWFQKVGDRMRRHSGSIPFLIELTPPHHPAY